jgi:AcrR family transcriptional regulator
VDADGHELPRRNHPGTLGSIDQPTEAAQRARVLRAAIDVVAARGYTDTAAIHIVRRARVSSRDFYRDFADKGECFLAALDHALDEVISIATVAFDGRDTWASGIHAAVRAVLEALARDPAIARICFLEVLAAGHEAWERRRTRVDRLAMHLCPEDPSTPHCRHRDLLAHTTIGGFSYVVQREAAAHTIASLPMLADELTYLAVLPFIGPALAAEAIDGRHRANSGASLDS